MGIILIILIIIIIIIIVIIGHAPALVDLGQRLLLGSGRRRGRAPGLLEPGVPRAYYILIRGDSGHLFGG